MIPCPTPPQAYRVGLAALLSHWLQRLGLQGYISSHLGGKSKDSREALGLDLKAAPPLGVCSLFCYIFTEVPWFLWHCCWTHRSKSCHVTCLVLNKPVDPLQLLCQRDTVSSKGIIPTGNQEKNHTPTILLSPSDFSASFPTTHPIDTPRGQGLPMMKFIPGSFLEIAAWQRKAITAGDRQRLCGTLTLKWKISGPLSQWVQ